MLAAWPFQSAPHFSSEANQFWGYYRCELWFVSIRASLQQRGEPEIRASVILRARVSIRASLQQRGELKCLRSSRRNSFVSIRASLQQRGEHSIGGGVDINISSFNPRLTSAARRTLFFLSRMRQRTGFNPRLTSAARRTIDNKFRKVASLVSIRASLQQRGEQQLLSNVFLFVHVSIRASLQQRGEQLRSLKSRRVRMVSIRASLQQRGEPRFPFRHPLIEEFQSAPHFSSEANQYRWMWPCYS